MRKILDSTLAIVFPTDLLGLLSHSLDMKTLEKLLGGGRNYDYRATVRACISRHTPCFRQYFPEPDRLAQ